MAVPSCWQTSLPNPTVREKHYVQKKETNSSSCSMGVTQKTLHMKNNSITNCAQTVCSRSTNKCRTRYSNVNAPHTLPVLHTRSYVRKKNYFNGGHQKGKTTNPVTHTYESPGVTVLVIITQYWWNLEFTKILWHIFPGNPLGRPNLILYNYIFYKICILTTIHVRHSTGVNLQNSFGCPKLYFLSRVMVKKTPRGWEVN